ncbi:MAG: ribosomal protein S18-alanine N-acetyltransferase [Terracidiphilus sp.]
MRSQPAINIRPLAESDLPRVLRIAESANEAPRWPRQTFVEMLSGEFLSRRIALVATDSGSGEALGFAVASLVPPEAELENIAVAREVQRRGIGRLLLSELVQELRHAGIETLLLEVRASNSAAIDLYSSFGFNESGRRSRYYSSPVEDAVLMTLKLR